MGKPYELRHSPALARVTVHVPAATQRFAILAFFVALHGIALQFCISTSGEAHQVALEKIRKKNREDFLNGTKEEDKMPYELPSEWAPNPWASASLFGTISLHAFFFLLCRWKVGFRSSVHFQDARQVREGYYVQVVPLPHRGLPALVPLTYCDTTCRLGFIFQRQHYEYLEPGDGGTDADEEVGEVQLLQCPVSELLEKYLEAKGLSSDDADHLKEKFGENLLEVELPTFVQCYKEQLLSPLVIFQIFVALVYAADDFVNYTLMQLLVILTMESTSVFQRLKTMKMLNNMGTKSFQIMVYRGRQWIEKSTSDLVPGDLIELVTVKSNTEATPNEKVAPDIVPCDCVMIRGEAVASEASLTGESAPQMKDALSMEDRRLDLQGRDRVHCLFSGTRIVRATEGTNKEEVEATRPAIEVPPTPNQGCLAYVVRTGFASSQGQLLQMIEFSQDKVSGDTREVIVAIVILLCCALLAAGYVLKVGLEKGDKTPHELLVKCVLILTAVVPKQLPIQTAMAVNTALMALSRAGVFCTEPYRVPLAGKLTHCLFDKTGTLTTDTLVPVGVVNRSSEPGPDGHLPKVQVADAETPAALVLAACHSLVLVDGNLTGDPIELAALEGIGWSFDSQAETASPQTKEDSPKAKKQGIKSVKILQRFHFASHLQRMAVVAEVATQAGSTQNLEGEGTYVLVKGSPEAVKKLLAKDTAPRWYDKSHTDLAERGLRVLALAYRRLPARQDKMAREEAEKDLIFAGFIAFECLVRKDSALVIGALNESGHKAMMVTGDSPLTALHIARTCGIADGQLPGLLLSKADEGEEWVVVTGDRAGEKLPSTESWTNLAKNYALMTTGDVLDAAVAREPELWKVVDEIRVFARMTPQGKAKIIEELQKQQSHVLMCGDGGNDVGALKQADAGLALLAGYGNVNTAENNEINETETAENNDETKKAEVALNQRDAELAKKNKKAAKARKDFLWQKQRELQDLQRQWLEEEIEARAKRGETGFMSQAGAMKASMGRYTEELKKQMKEYDKTHGNVYDEKDSSEAPKDPSAMLENLDQGGLPMVRPGDASIAAPFTTKAPSVKNCVDLIRQGRCTLLSALQQQQIMMLNCIINAYVLSALSLEGSRSSERQMMTSSWLLTTASLAFTYATPCDRMHPVRPLRSLFNPAVFISMLGQAAIHLFCMVAAVRMARAAMEEGSPERLAGWSGPSLQDVSEFWKRERLRRRGLIEQEEEMDWTQYALSAWTQPFLPNLMNTVVFLVETAQTVAILFVNYKGQPWMKGVMENRALFLSVLTVAGSVAAAAWEFQPQLNELIHLSPFPNDEFRWKVMGLVGLTLLGTFIWDRLCVLFFAPEIFKAMVDSAKRTTFKDDIIPVFVTVGKVVGVFVILGTGNLLMAGLAYYMYRRHSKDPDE